MSLSKCPLTTLKDQLSCSPIASEGVTGTISRRSDQHKLFLQSLDNLFEDNFTTSKLIEQNPPICSSKVPKD